MLKTGGTEELKSSTCFLLRSSSETHMQGLNKIQQGLLVCLYLLRDRDIHSKQPEKKCFNTSWGFVQVFALNTTASSQILTFWNDKTPLGLADAKLRNASVLLATHSVGGCPRLEGNQWSCCHGSEECLALAYGHTREREPQRAKFCQVYIVQHVDKSLSSRMKQAYSEVRFWYYCLVGVQILWFSIHFGTYCTSDWLLPRLPLWIT